MLAISDNVQTESQLPKLNVTSSNLVTRSWGHHPQEPTCGSTVKVLATHTKGGQTPAPRASGAGIFLAKGFVVSPLEEFIHRVPEDTERGIASMRIELEPLKLSRLHHPGDGGRTYTQQLPRLFCRNCLSFCHTMPPPKPEPGRDRSDFGTSKPPDRTVSLGSYNPSRDCGVSTKASRSFCARNASIPHHKSPVNQNLCSNRRKNAAARAGSAAALESSEESPRD